MSNTRASLKNLHPKGSGCDPVVSEIPHLCPLPVCWHTSRYEMEKPLWAARKDWPSGLCSPLHLRFRTESTRPLFHPPPPLPHLCRLHLTLSVEPGVQLLWWNAGMASLVSSLRQLPFYWGLRQAQKGAFSLPVPPTETRAIPLLQISKASCACLWTGEEELNLLCSPVDQEEKI